MAAVGDAETLLLWRALSSFRSGRRPGCRPVGTKGRSPCPLYDACPRWAGPDDRDLAFEESFEDTERRRASWPCSRLLDLLEPGVIRLGP